MRITPSSVSGSLFIPSSKSHTLRAILFAALAQGPSRIDNCLLSSDSEAMIQAVQTMGACVKKEGTSLIVKGGLRAASDVIQCGNSGLVLRLVGAIAALFPRYTILTGDASIRERRPVKPLLSGLEQLGATAISSLQNDRAPILVKGPLTKTYARVDGADSQPVSGLLIASTLAPHPITIQVDNAGETPWIDMTLYWLQKVGLVFQREGYHRYHLNGNGAIQPFSYSAPGDFSTAAFPIAAALVTGSPLTLYNLDMSDVQGDKALIGQLQQMGAKINTTGARVSVEPSSLQGARIDVAPFIDALPILAVLGCFASGKTELVNGRIARFKESDRIASIVQELKKMGANIEEKEDGLVIYPSVLQGAEVTSHFDHRLAMSLSVAALAAKGASTIHNTACIDKTWPSFKEAFQQLGANFA